MLRLLRVEVKTPLQLVKKIKDNYVSSSVWEVFSLFSTPVVKMLILYYSIFVQLNLTSSS